jgi:hypothetical protein
VRKAETQVRITGQLIDAATDAHLWASRFDGSLADIFELQDRVAVSVAGVIEPALQAAEIRRSAARPTTDLSAYDLYLRALAAFHQFTRERVFRSSGIARTGDRDRSALRAGAFLGGDLPPEARQRRLGRRAGDIPPQAMDLARQALQVSENDPASLPTPP